MHFLSQMKKHSLIPFNPNHPHQHFQLVEIETSRDGQYSYEKIYLSCPETGLSDELIQAYMISDLEVDESLDSNGLNEGCFWLQFQAGSVRIYFIDEFGEKINSAPIYSAKDPEVINLRTYCPDLFAYTFDA